MAVATAPPGRSLLGHLRVRLQLRAAAKGHASRAARVVGDHAGTMAALGFADTAMWHLGTFWGLLGTAVAVIIAEDKIRG
jgi:hypothetical protein